MAGFDPVRESSASSSGPTRYHRPATPDDQQDDDRRPLRDTPPDAEHRRPSRSASIVALLNPSDDREHQRPSSSASSSHAASASHHFAARHASVHSPSIDNYQPSANSPMSISNTLHTSPTSSYFPSLSLPHRSGSVSRPQSSGSANHPPEQYHHPYHQPQHHSAYSPRYLESADRSSAQPDDYDRQQPYHTHSDYPAHASHDYPSRHSSVRMDRRSTSQASHPGSAPPHGPIESPAPIPGLHSLAVAAAAASSPSPFDRPRAAHSPPFAPPPPGGFRVPEVPAHRSPEVRRVPLPPLRTSQGPPPGMSPPAAAGHDYYYAHPGQPEYPPDRTPSNALPPTPTMASPSASYCGQAVNAHAEYPRYSQSSGSPAGLPPTPGARPGSFGASRSYEAQSPSAAAYYPQGTVIEGHAASSPASYVNHPRTPGGSAPPHPGQTFIYSPPAPQYPVLLRRTSQQSDGSLAGHEDLGSGGAEQPSPTTSKRRRKSSGGNTSASRRSSQASWQSQEEIQAANAAAATMLSVRRKPSVHMETPAEAAEAAEENAVGETVAQHNGRNGIPKAGAQFSNERSGTDEDVPMPDTADAPSSVTTAQAVTPPASKPKPDPVFPGTMRTDTAPQESTPDDATAAAKRKRSSSPSVPAAQASTSTATTGKAKILDLEEVERLAQRDSKKRKSVSSLKDTSTSGPAKKGSGLPASLPPKPAVSPADTSSPSSRPRSDPYAAAAAAAAAANASPYPALPADSDDDTIPYRPTQRVSAPQSVRQPLSRNDLIGIHESMIMRGANSLRMKWANEERNAGREPRDGFWEGYVEQWDKRAKQAAESGGSQSRQPQGKSDGGYPQRTNESEVARHYNNRREVGLSARKFSPILPLKNFNNWVKSVLIGNFGRPDTKVMDMGGGKGGDLQKWDKLGIRELVLADIAATSVDQAKARYEERKSKFSAHFFALDCFGQTLGEVLPPEVLSPPFDMVSLQFCMHYGWSSLQKARLVIENVSRYLAPGGVFIGTIPDSEELYRRREALPADDFEFGNSLYHVRFEQKEKRKPFGDRYTFFLADAVEDVPEYVVDWEQFESLASEYGLKLTFKQPMSGVWHEFRQRREFELLAKKMRVCEDPRWTEQPMNDDLWAATTVYCAFAFTKTR